MKLHKKAVTPPSIFMIMFIFIVVLILSSLYVVIRDAEASKTDLVGMNAITLTKTYDETEKTMLYLDLAAKHASNQAKEILAENGGYSENNRCEKTLTTNSEQIPYVIWNSCPTLNPTEEFVKQFKQEFETFVAAYQSSYEQTDFSEEFGVMDYDYRPPIDVPAGIDDVYNYVITQNTRSSKLMGIQQNNNNLVITLSDIQLAVENSPTSVLVLRPQLRVDIQDLSLYGGLHEKISENCINKPSSSCKSSLEQTFPGIKVETSQELTEINLQTNNGEIQFVFNSGQAVAEYEGTTSYNVAYASTGHASTSTYTGSTGRCKVGAMGDSLTADGRYTKKLNNLCDSKLFVKHGVGGQGTGSMVKRFNKDIIQNNYRDVIVFAGVNDLASQRSAKTIKNNLAKMYGNASAKNIRVIALTITPWKGTRHWTPERQLRTEEVNRWILSKPENVDIVVDAYSLMDNGNAELKPEYDPGDHLHFNKAGHKALGNAIYSQIYAQEGCEQLECSAIALSSPANFAVQTEGPCKHAMVGLVPIPQDEKISCKEGAICCARPELIQQLEVTRSYIQPGQELVIGSAARLPKGQRDAYLAHLAGRVQAGGPKGLENTERGRQLETDVPDINGSRKEQVNYARAWLEQRDPQALAIIDDLSLYSLGGHIGGKSLDIWPAQGSTDENIRMMRNTMCATGWSNYGGEWWHYDFGNNAYETAKRNNKCYNSVDKFPHLAATVTPNYIA